MHCFTFGGALLILLTLVARKANGACQRRLGNEERGRECKRSCTSNAECRANNKKCLCDGACGLSCFNPNAECYPLEEIPNGSRNVTKSTVGGKALYWCNDGFSLIGSRTRKCYADKRWHPEAPTCELDPCGDPPAIQNGFLNATSTGIGERVIYNCNTGFGIRGRRRLTCRANRNWHPNVPTCENFSDCGRSWPKELLGRVVGGSNSLKNAWPWQVLIASSSSSMLESLEQDNNLLGGGSILNQKWVLSAAHVFQKAKIELIWPRNIIVFAGINKRPASGQTVEESVVAYSIGKYYEHEEFGEKTFVNDIALIEVGYKLDRNLRPIKSEAAGFTFGYSIKPVCLPKPLHSEDQPLVEEGTKFIVTGFGQTIGRSGEEQNFSLPRTLQQASLRKASDETCREHIEQINGKGGNYYALKFTESMLCSEPDQKDACKGDSGGPLVRNVEDQNTEETQWVQVGIVSFGYGCASNHSGYYTKVASFIPWINGKIAGTLDLMILIPGYRNRRNTDKNAYKDWLKTFGNYVTTTHAYTLSIYQYGQEYYQNGSQNPILESKLFLNGSSSLQFQSRIDSLNLVQRQVSRLYPDTITRIGATSWEKRKTPARNKILIILVENTIRRDHTNRISDIVSCMEYEGISVYFIGVTSHDSGDTSTFETRLKAIIGSLNRERNFHMADRQQLAEEQSLQSLKEYIEKRRDSCVLPSNAPGARNITCRWKSSTENTFHPGDKLFFECKKSSPGRTRYVEIPWYALCKTDGTWVFVKKDRCERE